MKVRSYTSPVGIGCRLSLEVKTVQRNECLNISPVPTVKSRGEVPSYTEGRRSSPIVYLGRQSGKSRRSRRLSGVGSGAEQTRGHRSRTPPPYFRTGQLGLGLLRPPVKKDVSGTTPPTPKHSGRSDRRTWTREGERKCSQLGLFIKNVGFEVES